jgi:Pentapeptide repeats (8 copies)
MTMQRFTFDHAIADVLQAPTDKFTDLVDLAGLDRNRDFRRADLRDCDFSDCDLAGYDFTGAQLKGSVFHRAFVAGATFDARTIRSGILLTAADSAQVMNPEVRLRPDASLDLLEDITVPFLWEAELWKMVGCLRAGKSVNLYGARGSGKTFLLSAVSKYLERRFDTKTVLVGKGSTDLGEALLRGHDVNRQRWQTQQGISLTKFQPTPIIEAIERISRPEDDVIYLIDDADNYDSSDIFELIANRDAVKMPIVVVSKLPLEPDGFAGSNNKLITAAMHSLNQSSIASFLKVLFQGHERVDIVDLMPWTEGLNIGQISRIASFFDQISPSDSIFKRVFTEEILEIIPMSGQSSEEERDVVARICWAIRSKKVGGTTVKQIARKAKVSLEDAIAAVDWMRSAGFVVRHGRRGYRFANNLLGETIVDVIGRPRTLRDTGLGVVASVMSG